MVFTGMAFRGIYYLRKAVDDFLIQSFMMQAPFLVAGSGAINKEDPEDHLKSYGSKDMSNLATLSDNAILAGSGRRFSHPFDGAKN